MGLCIANASESMMYHSTDKETHFEGWTVLFLFFLSFDSFANGIWVRRPQRRYISGQSFNLTCPILVTASSSYRRISRGLAVNLPS